jgi:transposase
MSTIPVSLTQEQFEQYIRPSLSVAKRGYECSIPLYKVFNYILYRLHTGCQWERLPIDNAPDDPQKKKSATMPSTITIANGVGTAA